MGDVLIARTIEYNITVPYEEVKKLWLETDSAKRDSNYTERERVNMYAILKYTNRVFDEQIELFERADNINLSVEPDTFATKDDEIVSFNYRVILSFVFNLSRDTPKQKEALIAQQDKITAKLETKGITYQRY